MEISYLVIIIHMIFTVISLCQFAYHKKAGQTARTYYLCIEKVAELMLVSSLREQKRKVTSKEHEGTSWWCDNVLT
jgi:hypothetical protein